MADERRGGDDVCDDRELTRRAAEGDPEVFGDLIRCYEQKILSAARMRCGDPADAEDVLQDTYVAAMRYLPDFRGDATVRAWLFRLAMSACTKRRRGRKNDPKLHVPLLAQRDDGETPQLDLPAGEAEDPERQTAVLQSMKDVSRVLQQMKELDRAVLLLVDGEGRKPSEAAELLGKTTPAIKSRLHRARKTFRAAVELSLLDET